MRVNNPQLNMFALSSTKKKEDGGEQPNGKRLKIKSNYGELSSAVLSIQLNLYSC
jgi:hypothetical protein